MNDLAGLEALYLEHCQAGRATSAHLPTLRELAARCELPIVEFGVNSGCSTTALLLGADDGVAPRVISYDYNPNASTSRLAELAGEGWEFRDLDTRKIEALVTGEEHSRPSGRATFSADLLFVDSLHTFDQTRDELRHADRVRRWIVFHDTITFGSVGADGETGQPDPSVLGIRPAIDDLMIRDPSWRIRFHHTHSHGLLCLGRS